ncbi:hypothetical protein RI129_007819 [Pyrocoelia pectoralis]|uniref:Protein YIPF n=1 Tax=Pyrocoelia pectoralis TaxID=417401 RepID=A0AAN7VD21_9COLE
MTGMQEVPTDELLSFQDFPDMPNPSTYQNFSFLDTNSKAFWTLNYYQQFFDIDTSEVVERLLSSIFPKRNSMINNQIKLKPDLYGPFWISMTLIFTIAISGNVASYLQHANEQYHWKYNFHLVSYVSTTIVFYVSVIPLILWGLLNKPLELICVYGYSLFVYIPVSILWSIQVIWLQWMLVLIAAVLSGSVLVLTLYPALQLSKRKFILVVYVACCHLLLAIGFKVFFFHMPESTIVVVPHPPLVSAPSVSQAPNATVAAAKV